MGFNPAEKNLVACHNKSITMLYMVVEHFHKSKVKEMYKRFAEKGRMLPAGVEYINSWINEEVTVCYQVMESDSLDKLNTWIANWDDLVDFEVIPVISSAEAKRKVMS
jgi:hypothetical protein